MSGRSHRVRALSVLLLASLAVYCGSRGPGEDVDIGATVIYKFGRLVAAGRSAKAGDNIPGGTRVDVGRKSLANLQITGATGRIALLVRENSKIILRARRYGSTIDYTPVLVHGKILLKVEDLAGSERVLVDAPGIEIAVTGTQFTIQQSAAGTNVDVLKGAVQVRPRLPWLEQIPAEIREQSEVLRSVDRSLVQAAETVAAGERGSFDASFVAEVARAVPELKRLANNSRFHQAANAEEARKLAEGIDGDLINMNFHGSITKAIEKEREKWVESRSLSEEEHALVEKQHKRVLVLTPDTMPDLRAVKTLETVHLTNGKRIVGVILKESSGPPVPGKAEDVRIWSMEGGEVLSFSTNQIDHISFDSPVEFLLE